MQTKHKLHLWITVLVLVSISCSLSTANNSNSNSSENNVDIPSAQEQPQNSNVLFEDDFSDSSTGWDQYYDEDGSTDYYQNNYLITVDLPDYSFWATAYQDFTDVVIEVDAFKLRGGEDDEFGVVCRHADPNNFYMLVISSDGFAAINKRVDGSELIPLTDGFQPFDAINQGVETNNHLKAECVGDRLTLYANGELLLEVNDSDIASGDVGLYAGTFGAESTEVTFDNYIVTKP